MKIKYDFAILGPDSKDTNIIALKEFLERYDLKVCLLPYVSESLREIIDDKIGNVVVFNEADGRFATQFIVDASIKKIFKETTFYYLSYQALTSEEQVKLMTLGYMGFIQFPFSAHDVQNTIDLFEATVKLAS